ncbi:MAG: porin [Pseudomonadota bacterium]|nr:porin [Pseudomonadota bacterium]
MKRLCSSILAPLLLVATTAILAAEPKTPTIEDLWKIIQQQQAEIEALKQQQQNTAQQAEEADKKAVVADEKAEAAVVAVEESATKAHPFEKTTLGGYGELHYNNLDSKEEVDFHRFVLTLGHAFTDSIRLFSELELEHSVSGDGEDGEFELEQAYLEFDLNEQHSVKTGLFLVPVGILNDTHEPPTFYGVERNPVEKNIIPTTWWEAGADFHGELGKGFSYNLAGTSGLNVDTSGSKAFLIRNGRQKASKAKANDGAVTGRVKWTGIPGVELGLTGQWQKDITQGQLGVGATLLEAHADIQRGPFGFRALYAHWNLDNHNDINASDPSAAGRDEQEGWYIEPSYKTRVGTIPGEWGLFVRYNVWDNNAGSSNDTEMKQINAGLNYWPIPDVVFKFDAQSQDNEGDKNDNGFNLGIGYQF